MGLFSGNKLREYILLIVFCICILIIAFYPAVFNNQIVYLEDPAGSDSLDHTAAKRYLAAQSLLKYGEFPLWEPRIGCGAPLFAQSEAGVLHPALLFYLFTDITHATNLTVLSAILIAMLGSYAWARCLGLDPLPSAISSLTYGFSAWFLGQTQALNIIHIIALLPVSLAFIYLGATNNSKLCWFGLVAVWTLQILASHFETFTICQICCWIYIIWLFINKCGFSVIPRRKLLLFSISALLFAVCIGSVQLLSTYEFVCKSSRYEAVPLEWIQKTTSVNPDPIRFIDPFRPTSIYKAGETLDKFWVANNRQYIGIFAVLLCLYSFVYCNKKMVIGFWIIALFFYIASLGPKYGIYYLFWRFVPFMSSFRFANRYAIPMVCFLAVLAAIGAQNLSDLLKKHYNKYAAYSVLLILIVCICIGRIMLNYRIQSYLPAVWATQPQVLTDISNHQRIFSIASQVSHAKNVFCYHPAETWEQNLKQRQNIMWHHRSLLSPGMLPLWDAEAPDDYVTQGNGIVIANSANMQKMLYLLGNDMFISDPAWVSSIASKYDEWLKIFGISHIISPAPLPEGWPQSEFNQIYSAPIDEIPGRNVFVYALVNPVKIIRLVPNLQTHVPVDTLDLESFLQIHTGSLYEEDFAHPADIGQVTVEKSTNHTMDIHTKCDRDAYLVVGITYDSNWQAAVDGQPADIRLTNLAMQSLFVPKGEHRIELRYVSPAFELGWKISLVSLIIFIGLGICVAFRESQRNADS